MAGGSAEGSSQSLHLDKGKKRAATTQEAVTSKRRKVADENWEIYCAANTFEAFSSTDLRHFMIGIVIVGYDVSLRYYDRSAIIPSVKLFDFIDEPSFALCCGHFPSLLRNSGV